MKKDAKENGITLVALVVTIIVLLILAGVSLSLVLGDNGIITRAQDAVMKYKEAAEEEKWQMDNFMADYGDEDSYARALQKNGLSATATENGFLAAEDAEDGENVKFYHYDDDGILTKTEVLAYAPEELFMFDQSTKAITGINMNYTDGEDVYYEDDTTADGIHLAGITGTLVIPNKIGGVSVEKIGLGADRVVSGLWSIGTVIVPNGVTEISDDAFRDCEDLECVLLPNSIERIGDYSFHFCTKLKKIVFPESVQGIDEHTFCRCEELRDFSFPKRAYGDSSPFLRSLLVFTTYLYFVNH